MNVNRHATPHQNELPLRYRPPSGRFFHNFSIILFLALVLASCDQPPDPNRPVRIDDTLSIAQLTNAIGAAPEDFDTGPYIKLRGAWTDFAQAGDPLGALYYAVAPLGVFTAKKIKLDLRLITGIAIDNSDYLSVEQRAHKEVFEAVIFPAGITYIGNYAFYGCTGLSTLAFTGGTPPTISSNALSGIHNPLELWIPGGIAYQALISDLEGKGISVTAHEGLPGQ